MTCSGAARLAAHDVGEGAADIDADLETAPAPVRRCRPAKPRPERAARHRGRNAEARISSRLGRMPGGTAQLPRFGQAILLDESGELGHAMIDAYFRTNSNRMCGNGFPPRPQRQLALPSGKSISMPASITLSDLAWSTPDGRPLFSNLDLTFGAGRTGLVGRNGVRQDHAAQARSPANCQPQSGSGLRQRQPRRPAPDRSGRRRRDGRRPVRRHRRAGRPAPRRSAARRRDDELAAADWTLEARIAAALGRLGLDAPPETPLATLSGGQRTRAGLAALVFAEPDFLLLDEPTNNLDRDGREAVIDLLAGWRAGAIVVSHDRELLDTMDAIVELTTLGATRYGGNWSRLPRAQGAWSWRRHGTTWRTPRSGVADVARTRAGDGRAAGAQGRRGPAEGRRRAGCRASCSAR